MRMLAMGNSGASQKKGVRRNLFYNLDFVCFRVRSKESGVCSGSDAFRKWGELWLSEERHLLAVEEGLSCFVSLDRVTSGLTLYHFIVRQLNLRWGRYCEVNYVLTGKQKWPVFWVSNQQVLILTGLVVDLRTVSNIRECFLFSFSLLKQKYFKRYF